jgi:4-hydroxy-3-polyprenylbenzoate decarboxylase
VKRIVVGMTGASGSIYGIRLLQVLAAVPDVETHLVMSTAALADVLHDTRDVSASIASGSFRVAGMAVVPCSIKTLSSVANSYSDNLLTRAADVTLKERRPLVLLVRETPLHVGHCRLLLDAATAGAIIMPPVPSFYTRPATLDDMVDHTVGRLLDLFDVDSGLVKRWREESSPAT